MCTNTHTRELTPVFLCVTACLSTYLSNLPTCYSPPNTSTSYPTPQVYSSFHVLPFRVVTLLWTMGHLSSDVLTTCFSGQSPSAEASFHPHPSQLGSPLPAQAPAPSAGRLPLLTLHAGLHLPRLPPRSGSSTPPKPLDFHSSLSPLPEGLCALLNRMQQLSFSLSQKEEEGLGAHIEQCSVARDWRCGGPGPGGLGRRRCRPRGALASGAHLPSFSLSSGATDPGAGRAPPALFCSRATAVLGVYLLPMLRRQLRARSSMLVSHPSPVPEQPPARNSFK